jgi:hypothetical protein
VSLYAETVLYELVSKAFIVRGFQESAAESPVNGDRVPDDTPSKIIVVKSSGAVRPDAFVTRGIKSVNPHAPSSNNAVVPVFPFPFLCVLCK